MIAIVAAGLGNIGSIANMLDRVGAASVITSDIDVISAAERIILPGVGAFDRGMRHLADLGLIEPLTELVTVRRVPTLGICLGMQLMARGSEEGVLPGLGWIAADVVRFDDHGVRVPHMGWNVVHSVPSAALFGEPQERFYFVHSYFVRCDDSTDVAAWAHHGTDFAAAVAHDNIVGVQFHPEKSHRFGLALLERFASFAPAILD